MEEREFQTFFQKISRNQISDPSKTIFMINNFLLKDLTPKQNLKIKIIQGNCFRLLSEIDKSLSIFKEVSEKAKELNFIDVYADSLSGIGEINEIRGNIKLAISQFKEAIKIYQKHSLLIEEAQVTNKLAKVLVNQGKLDKAQYLFKRVVELARKKDIVLEIRALNNIAFINQKRGNFKAANENYRKCAQLAYKNKLERLHCITLNNYADSLWHLGEYSKAKRIFEEGLLSARKINDLNGISILASSYAEFLIDFGNFEESLALYNEAIQLNKKSEGVVPLITSLRGLAKLWFAKGDPLKSISFLKEALDLIQKYELNIKSINIHVALAETYEAINEIDKAYMHLNKAQKLVWQFRIPAGRVKILFERARINTRLLNLNCAEILIADGLRLLEELHDVELIFKGILLLTNIFLLKYQQNTNNESFFHMSIQKILFIKEQARNQGLIPIFIKSSVIEAMLYFIKKDINLGKEILKTTLTIAQEKGMLKQALFIKERIELMSEEMRNINSIAVVDSSSQNYSTILSDIPKMLGNYSKNTINQNDINKIFLLSYKVDEIFGPTLISTFNINLNKRNILEKIETNGSLYITTIGQGQNYINGLFGPFPFGMENLNALVYCQNLFDPKQKSGRNEGNVYFMLSIVYPNRLNSFLYDLQSIEEILNNFFLQVQRTTDISTRLLQNVFSVLITKLFQNFIIQSI